jgi:hypothetical protein
VRHSTYIRPSIKAYRQVSGHSSVRGASVAEPDVFNSLSHVGLTSDHQTFVFGSGAPYR